MTSHILWVHLANKSQILQTTQSKDLFHDKSERTRKKQCKCVSCLRVFVLPKYRKFTDKLRTDALIMALQCTILLYHRCKISHSLCHTEVYSLSITNELISRWRWSWERDGDRDLCGPVSLCLCVCPLTSVSQGGRVQGHTLDTAYNGSL